MARRMQGEDVDRTMDTFHRVLAKVLEPARHLPNHVIAYRSRESDTANGCNRLQPRGDDDAFAIDIVALDDDIAKIDADTVANARCFGALGFGARRRLLGRECAVDGRETLENSTSAPSPMSLTRRPPWAATQGSKTWLRLTFSLSCVPASSTSVKAV